MKTTYLYLGLFAFLFLFISPAFPEIINSQPSESNVIDDTSKQLVAGFIKLTVKEKTQPVEVVLLFQPMNIETLPSWIVRDFSKNHFVGEKMIIVDPVKHTWTAYSATGKPLRSGLATAGASFCPDIGRGCRTKIGVFRIQSLGSAGCRSHKFPVPYGGAPMPYCMFFNGGQGLHGSYEVVRGNVSHGCVRLHVEDAKWIRFNFATIGTKVVIKPY